MRQSAWAGSGIGPDQEPEWSGAFVARSVTLMALMPRSVVVMEGVFFAKFPRSATMTASHFKSSACSVRIFSKPALPDSSSPSMMNLRFGPLPLSSRRTCSSAARCVMIPALSSAVPRPKRRSPLSVAVNGGVFQSASLMGGCTS